MSYYDELFKRHSLRPWVTVVFGAIPNVRFDHHSDPDSSKFRYVKSMDHLVVPQQGSMQVVFEIYDEGGYRLTDILATAPTAKNWGARSARVYFRYGYASSSVGSDFKTAWHSAVIRTVECQADGGGVTYTITADDDLSYTVANSTGTGTQKFPGIVSALKWLFETLQLGPKDTSKLTFEAQEVKDDNVVREYHLDGLTKIETAYAWMRDHVGNRGRKLQLTYVYDSNDGKTKVVLSEEPSKKDPGKDAVLLGWPEEGMQVCAHHTGISAPAVIGFEPKFDLTNVVALNYVGTSVDSSKRSYVASGPLDVGNRADRVYVEDTPVGPRLGGVTQKISGRVSQPLEEPLAARDLLTQSIRHMNERVRPTITLYGVQADLTLVGMPGRPGPPTDWTHPFTFLGGGIPRRWVTLFVYTPYSISYSGPAEFLVQRLSMTQALSGYWYITAVSHRITVDGGYTTVFSLQMLPTPGTELAKDLVFSDNAPSDGQPPPGGD